MIRYDTAAAGNGSPPGFLEARNRRQKARAAGLSPDHFYPVTQSKKLRRGQVIGTCFWGRPIAVFRDQTGKAHALEDRCAHRQLKLSLGQVKDCNLVCQYHGWEYGGDGKVVAIPHELHGKPFPDIKVGSFPVRERYGLVWIFPGDPSLAEARSIPEIPELSGSDPWGLLTIDCEWKTHHSMIIDNVSDITRANLHRKYNPFWDARMTRCEAVGDRVYVGYDTHIRSDNIFGRFVEKAKVGKKRIELCYEYPYKWSSIEDMLKEYCFVLPMDERTSHVFFLFYFKSLRDPFLAVANKLLLTPLIRKDRSSCEAELEGYLRNYDAPIAEFSPAVGLFQQLTIRKWEEYLASRNVVRAEKVAQLGTNTQAARTWT